MKRLLIANRGEIAVRVARAAREMEIVPLGIYSEADAHAFHLQFMDEVRCVGPAPAADSYLNADAIIAAAHAMKADALHPGYGFLSERAPFARAVRDAGLIFVGPTPDAMAAMGSKIEAKRRVRTFNVPTIRGYDGDDQSEATLQTQAHHIGFPLLIKASAGGGGRGMRIVESLAGLREALESAKRESLAAFGDDRVLLERYLLDPRHIEFRNSRRLARHHDPSRRARMLDPAAPPKDRRGGAVGGAHARTARRNGRGGRSRRRIG